MKAQPNHDIAILCFLAVHVLIDMHLVAAGCFLRKNVDYQVHRH